MPAETPRMSALKQLSQQMPVANRRLAGGLQAARDIQLQRAVAAAPAAPTAQAAQQIGTAQAATAGQQQLQLGEQALQQQAQLAQLGAQKAQRESRATLQRLEAGEREQRLRDTEKFSKLNEQAKNQMLDARLKFNRDEMGRAYFNERQLADFAKMSARSDEEFQNWSQKSRQAHEFKIKMLDAAHRKIMSVLQNEQQLKELGLDAKQQIELRQRAKQLEEQMRRDAAEAANKQAMWSAVGGIVLAGGVTAVTGGAAAPYAPALYQAGAGAGSIAAAQS
jgi:hypothetical protein